MRFDDLDNKMRKYEQSLDVCILPEINLVARLDGRSFHTLSRSKNFETPFDTRFRDYMVAAVKDLMDCGFKITYAYTESDEISLLFSPLEDAFNRKTRKYNSILASVAAVAFSMESKYKVNFDCRMIPLPTKELVVDYFRWRQEDATRNCLQAYCYWTLRKEGKSARKATKLMDGLGFAAQNELLFSKGINFNDIPAWQKRGIGCYFKVEGKEGFNPITNEIVTTQRNKLYFDYELPYGDAYNEYIKGFLN